MNYIINQVNYIINQVIDQFCFNLRLNNILMNSNFESSEFDYIMNFPLTPYFFPKPSPTLQTP